MLPNFIFQKNKIKNLKTILVFKVFTFTFVAWKIQ